MVSLTVQFLDLINYRVFPSVQGVVRQELFPPSGAVRMLYMTRNTICRTRTKPCVATRCVRRRRMTRGASLPRRRAVYWIKALMTTRTCDQAARISLYALRSFQPCHMYRVKIPAQPRLLVFVAGCRAIDLRYCIRVLAINTFPFPNAVNHGVTI